MSSETELHRLGVLIDKLEYGGRGVSYITLTPADELRLFREYHESAILERVFSVTWFNFPDIPFTVGVNPIRTLYGYPLNANADTSRLMLKDGTFIALGVDND